MSEKLYALILKLYPAHFRRTYGDEALRLVRDRAHDEKGFLSGLRLWLDLLLDLVISLPHEYTTPPTAPIAAAQPVNGDLTFQLLDARSPNPALLFLAGIFSAVLLWACVTAVARSRTFPAFFPDSHSLQALVQRNLALARLPPAVPADAYNFCLSAHRAIPDNSTQPLFTFHFAAPGASGVALIDGNIVKAFRNEQVLSISANVSAGDHQFALDLNRPAENISMSRNDDVENCTPR